VEIIIFNLEGEDIISKKSDLNIAKQTYQFDFSAFPDGIYFASLIINSSKTKSLKLVKESN